MVNDFVLDRGSSISVRRLVGNRNGPIFLSLEASRAFIVELKSSS